jgi:head-tail adaptor
MGSSKRPLLRTPVRIEQQVRTADEGGGYALDWAALYSTMAERSDLSGSETLRAATLTNTKLNRYKMRWPPSLALDETMRLIDKQTGVAYNIRDISGPDQHERWITLLCERIPGSTGA